MIILRDSGIPTARREHHQLPAFTLLPYRLGEDGVNRNVV